MKHRFSDLLSLSSAERKGVIVLVFLILLLAGFQAYVAFKPHVASFEDTAFFKEFTALEKNEDRENVASYDSVHFPGYEPVQEMMDETELFSFDPNTVSAADLRRLGINSGLTRTWLNYRFHGGKFRKASDIRKIYGITPEIFNRLEPVIIIDDRFKERQYFAKTEFRVTEKTGINTCDSSNLVKLRGVGPVLSGRIIRYRKLLGGFQSLEQLNEVYGFPDSLLSIVRHSFYVDTSAIRTININETTEEDLQKHPYIGRYLAAGIIKYRKSVLKIASIEELKINGIFSSTQFERVKKYLSI